MLENRETFPVFTQDCDCNAVHGWSLARNLLGSC
jgi:hypothetical protein